MPLAILRTNHDLHIRVLCVQIEDAIESDHVFEMLVGDVVERRREFIESNVLRAADIDV